MRVCWVPWCAVVLGPGAAWAEESYAVKLEAVVGNIRVKPAGELNWQDLEKTRLLQDGDLLFTGERSSVKVVYVNARATLAIPPETMLRVSEQPPYMSRYRRTTLDPGGERTLTLAASPAQAKREGGESEAVNTAFSVTREVAVIPVVFPEAGAEIFVRRFPATLAFRLGVTRGAETLWGYLWEKDGSPQPIWLGMGNGNFSQIPVNKAGSYIFQAVAEDDAASSIPVEVKVRLGTSFQLVPLPPGGRQTVIIK